MSDDVFYGNTKNLNIIENLIKALYNLKLLILGWKTDRKQTKNTQTTAKMTSRDQRKEN